jgi:hypothetical protein
MKSIIEVKFKQISGQNVDNSLLALEPRLIKSTEETMKKLCDTIVKYFKDYNIIVEVSNKVKKD